MVGLSPPPAGCDTLPSCQKTNKTDYFCFASMIPNDAGLSRSWYAELPVLYVVLHVQVIDEQRVPQLGVAHGLIQREPWFTGRDVRR